MATYKIAGNVEEVDDGTERPRLTKGIEYMEECGALERKVAYKSVLDEMEILERKYSE
jgi:hypothetical protein